MSSVIELVDTRDVFLWQSFQSRPIMDEDLASKTRRHQLFVVSSEHRCFHKTWRVSERVRLVCPICAPAKG